MKTGTQTNRSRLITVIVVTFLLAVGVTMQIKTELIPNSNLVARDQSLVHSVQALENDNAALRGEMQSLTNAVATMENQLGERSAAAKSLEDLTAAQRDLAGLSPVAGPGIVVQLASGVNPHRPDDTRNDWEVSYVDIQDVVNMLWANGAEAVSVNRQRVVPTTSFFVAKPDVLLNGVHLASPYEIDAVGDSSKMDQAMGDDNNLQDLKQRSEAFQLKLSWKTQRSVSLAAFDGAFVVRYAVAGD